MKDTRIKLSDGRTVVITNRQMWRIVLRIALSMALPALAASLVAVALMRWLMARW